MKQDNPLSGFPDLAGNVRLAEKLKKSYHATTNKPMTLDELTRDLNKSPLPGVQIVQANIVFPRDYAPKEDAYFLYVPNGSEGPRNPLI